MGVEINDEERMCRAVRSLRNMLRDKKELNRLLAGQFESTDEELRFCIMHALMDWNTTPPPLRIVTLTNHPSKVLLLQGAAIQAMTSAGIWHSREHMPSSDGGTSADDHAKASEYSGWIERYVAEYERKKSDIKVMLNIAAANGNMTISSEYAASFYSLYGELW
jgi:hypothetical protein